MTELFDLLKACLFTGEDVRLHDWQSIFCEMKEQAVAALPGEWLKTHPVDPEWSKYCSFQQGRWVRVMHAQDEVIALLESHHIPSVIIKGAAAAMYYPYPTIRPMGDVDVLVMRKDYEKAAEILETNGYTLTHEKRDESHHYNYRKDKISIELHRKLPVIDDEDENLLTFFEEGIDQREWRVTAGSNKFPVLPPLLNGLVLIFHINQHLRSGLGLRQIIDWMMYADQLSACQWEELRTVMQRVGMEKLALTTTAMCQQYLGLKACFSGCEEVEPMLCDELMGFILTKGIFGKKAGVNGKMGEVFLFATERGGFFKRLQDGGLLQWKAARKHKFLRPFAWIYQGIRIVPVLIKNKITPKDMMRQRQNGMEQRQLIEALGLKMDRTIRM